MWIRSVVHFVAGAVVVLVLATPAAAQGTKMEVGAGYQLLIADSEGGYFLPAGWSASVGIGKDWLKFIGEAAGHYGGDAPFPNRTANSNLHTFQGGVEVSGRGKAAWFARALAGLGYFSGGDAFQAFVFTPEFGLKVRVTDKVGVQAGLGFPIVAADDATRSFARFFVGVVYGK